MEGGDDQPWGPGDDGRVDRETEGNILAEVDRIDRNCHQAFENSTAAITNLHRDRLRVEDAWLLFQHAAGSVTELYRVAAESRKTAYDLGVRMGHHKNNKELRMCNKKYLQRMSKDERISRPMGSPKSRTPPQRTKTTTPKANTFFAAQQTCGQVPMGFVPSQNTFRRDVQATTAFYQRDSVNYCVDDPESARGSGEKRNRSSQSDDSFLEPCAKRRHRHM